MKTLKSVLAMVMAVCLMLCLAVPAFATTEDPTDATITSATDATTGVDTNDTSAGDTSESVESDEALTEDEHDHDHEDEVISTDDIVVGTGAATTQKPGVLKIILLVLEALASIVLIVVVLMQSGKEAGLSGALSGNSDSYMNKGKTGGLDKILASSTKWIALVWIIITLVLSLI